VRTTPDGTVWVSYFDESACVGATPGLATFSAEGQRRFAYEPKVAGTDWICDAYALNVAGNDDAWLYFYNEFPIVRVHQGRYQVWRTKKPVAGARGLAVAPERALLYRTYDDHASACVLELGAKGVASAREPHQVVDERGAPLEAEVA
jgi:hypothetical protein